MNGLEMLKSQDCVRCRDFKHHAWKPLMFSSRDCHTFYRISLRTTDWDG